MRDLRAELRLCRPSRWRRAGGIAGTSCRGGAPTGRIYNELPGNSSKARRRGPPPSRQQTSDRRHSGRSDLDACADFRWAFQPGRIACGIRPGDALSDRRSRKRPDPVENSPAACGRACGHLTLGATFITQSLISPSAIAPNSYSGKPQIRFESFLRFGMQKPAMRAS